MCLFVCLTSKSRCNWNLWALLLQLSFILLCFWLIFYLNSLVLTALSSDITISDFHSNITLDWDAKSATLKALTMTIKRKRKSTTTATAKPAITATAMHTIHAIHMHISVMDKTIYFDEPNWFFPASPFILNVIYRSTGWFYYVFFYLSLFLSLTRSVSVSVVEHVNVLWY